MLPILKRILFLFLFCLYGFIFYNLFYYGINYFSPKSLQTPDQIDVNYIFNWIILFSVTVFLSYIGSSSLIKNHSSPPIKKRKTKIKEPVKKTKTDTKKRNESLLPPRVIKTTEKRNEDTNAV